MISIIVFKLDIFSPPIILSEKAVRSSKTNAYFASIEEQENS